MNSAMKSQREGVTSSATPSLLEIGLVGSFVIQHHWIMQEDIWSLAAAPTYEVSEFTVQLVPLKLSC